jgi:hypothetical protein
MASNNLAVGAKALLDAGADPAFRGGSGQAALDVAKGSQAADVIRVLQEHGAKRAPIRVTKITVTGAGVGDVNGDYVETSAAETPAGFAKVCEDNGWDTAAMWAQLNAGKAWFGAENGAYIYFNASDRNWCVLKTINNPLCTTAKKVCIPC